MGAGISRQAARARIRRSLHRVVRELTEQGIPCEYHKSLEVRGANFVAYYAGCGPASNGESMSWPVMRVNPAGRPYSEQKRAGDEDYYDLTNGQPRSGWWDDGIKRVKALMERGENATT